MNDSLNSATFHQAIVSASKSEILKLLQEKTLNFKDSNEKGETILHLIFQNKHLAEKDVVELIEIFLHRGVDPNIQSTEGLTALHLAVSNRWRDVVDLLLKHKIYTYRIDEDGNSIAHFFVEDENKKFCELLKIKSDDYEMLDIKEHKMEQESASFAEWLISKDFDFDYPNEEGKSALNLSISYNLHHISIVLLRHTQEINQVNVGRETLLHSFLHHNYYGKIMCCENIQDWYEVYCLRYATNIVNLLLDSGVDIDAVDCMGQTCLRIAIEYKEDMKVMEMLVDHLLKNNTDFFSATNLELFECTSWWGESRTEYLLTDLQIVTTQGANVNIEDENGRTALYYSFKAKNLQVIKFLIDYDADFHIITNDGENLFHALSSKEFIKRSTSRKTLETLFELIISKGCRDVNRRNKGKETPLHLASSCGNITLVRKLIEYGAVINCRSRAWQTPLILAANCDEAEDVVELLVQNGADVNARDVHGGRPLINAVISCHKSETIRLLLQNGAYVNVYTREGESLCCSAIQNDQIPTAKEMLMYGAKLDDQSIVEYLYDETEKLVFHHWIKLEAANLNKYENLVNKKGYKKFHKKCLNEVKRLKATLINTRTSIYDFMHMGFARRRFYVNNEKIKNLVDSPKLEEQFPQYFVLILASYREVIMWKSLLEPAKRAWNELTKILLPEECIEMIFASLTNEDLVSMIEFKEDLQIKIYNDKIKAFLGLED